MFPAPRDNQAAASRAQRAPPEAGGFLAAEGRPDCCKPSAARRATPGGEGGDGERASRPPCPARLAADENDARRERDDATTRPDRAPTARSQTTRAEHAGRRSLGPSDPTMRRRWRRPRPPFPSPLERAAPAALPEEPPSRASSVSASSLVRASCAVLASSARHTFSAPTPYVPIRRTQRLQSGNSRFCSFPRRKNIFSR